MVWFIFAAPVLPVFESWVTSIAATATSAAMMIIISALAWPLRSWAKSCSAFPKGMAILFFHLRNFDKENRRHYSVKLFWECDY